MKSALIIPTFREKENLPSICEAVVNLGVDCYIVVVDDNSPDGTGDVADEIAALHPEVRVIHRPGREGYGRALVAAFRYVITNLPEVEYMISMDADFSHQPRYLPTLMENLSHADVVVGSRYIPGGGVVNWSLRRRLLSRLGNAYARLMTRLPIHDCTSGFMGYRRKVIESLPLDLLRVQGYSFLIEMKYRAYERGFAVKEFPIVFVERARGTSKMNFRIALEALALVWKLRARRRR